MVKIRRSLEMIILFTMLLAGCVPVPAAETGSRPLATPDYWPTEMWRTTTPEEQGLDSQKLAEMAAHIQAEQLELHSLLIVRNGYLVTEIYGHPYTSEQTHWVASVTKSVLSTLVGIAIQEGKLEGVRQSLWSLLPRDGVKNFDRDKEKISLEDLLTMTSGFDCIDNPPSGQPAMERSENWVGFTLDLPMAAAPGTRYTYCSGVSQVLSAALQQAAGMNGRAYANQVLFPLIGIAPVTAEQWPSDPQGVTIGGYELYLTPRQMAKFGLLFLHRGRWEAQQVVPAEWVASATTWHIDRDDGLGYGYLWSIDPSQKAYAAMGRAGQYIFIYPELNMVIVFTGGINFREKNDFTPLAELLNEYILPAVKSDQPLPPNPAAQTRLQTAVQILAQPRKDPPPLPALAATISGKAFSFKDNPLGWNALSFEFTPGQSVARITFDRVHYLEIGLDNLYRVTASGSPSFPVGLRGHWENDDTFIVEQSWIGKMTEYTYTFRFASDSSLTITRLEKYSGEEIGVESRSFFTSARENP